MVAFIEEQTPSKPPVRRNSRSGSRACSFKTPYPRSFDARVGLRYYDKNVGRWTTQDPLGVEAGLNQYCFAGNNPVNYIDPLGLCSPCGYGGGQNTVSSVTGNIPYTQPSAPFQPTSVIVNLPPGSGGGQNPDQPLTNNQMMQSQFGGAVGSPSAYMTPGSPGANSQTAVPSAVAAAIPVSVAAAGAVATYGPTVYVAATAAANSPSVQQFANGFGPGPSVPFPANGGQFAAWWAGEGAANATYNNH